MPTTCAWPACGASAAITSRSSGESSSTSEISRATARASPSRARATRSGTRPGCDDSRWRSSGPGTRTISASPWPPPPHSAAAPTPPPRRLSSSARCSTIRAPDMPTGWPSAIAPPLTLTLSSVEAELAGRRDADRGEGLVELDQVEVGGGDALLLAGLARSRWPAAAAGVESGPATRPCAPISASHSRPELLGLGLAHHDDGAGAVGDLRGRAGGDGAVLGERRAQLAQRLGGGVAADALVLVTTTGSPLRCGISTGTTSSSKTPFFQAAAACWCERAANSSCSSRVRFAAARRCTPR